MSRIRVLNTSIFLFIIFLLQETLVSRINFPINGFSLYLAALMVLLSLEDRNGALVFGFIGGLIMDLSAAADTPFGQWALVLTVIGFLFSVNKESIGDFTESPILFLIFISLASALSLFLFLLVGAMLGQENGTFTHAFSIIFANTLWSFLITPLVLPLIIKGRTALLSNRERA
ncbi:MAG: rod shape-determining protein MreD [Actinobacteria bacterium]|nr:rod shape-determining protein MreD [Actinomycetota bacterium]